MYKNIISVFSTNIFSLVISLLNSVLLSRYLGGELRGSYVLLSTSIMLLSYLLSFGLNTGITFYSAKSNSVGKKILSNSILFSFATSLLTSLTILILLLFSEWISIFFPKQINPYILFISIFISIFLYLTHSNISAYYAGIKNFKKINLSKIYTQLSLFIILIFLTLLFPIQHTISNNIIIIIFTFPILLQLTPYLSIVSSLEFDLKNYNTKTLSRLIKWGSIPYFASLIQYLNYKLDFWFIEHYSDSHSVLGEYSLSSSLAQLIWLVPTSIGTVLMPSLINIKNKKERTTKISLFTLLIAILIGGIFIFGSNLFIPLVYGDDFTNVAQYLNILIIGSIPYSTTIIFATFFISLNKTKVNLIASVFGFLITLLLNIIFIPKYGAVGAAWTTSASYIITTIIVVYTYINEKIK